MSEFCPEQFSGSLMWLLLFAFQGTETKPYATGFKYQEKAELCGIKKDFAGGKVPDHTDKACGNLSNKVVDIKDFNSNPQAGIIDTKTNE